MSSHNEMRLQEYLGSAPDVHMSQESKARILRHLLAAEEKVQRSNVYKKWLVRGVGAIVTCSLLVVVGVLVREHLTPPQYASVPNPKGAGNVSAAQPSKESGVPGSGNAIDAVQKLPTVYTGAWGLPLPADSFVMTSMFGPAYNPDSKMPESSNDGIDLAAPQGTDVYAAADGVVTDVGYSPDSGYSLTIAHSSKTKTTYSHLLDNSAAVAKGQAVKQGEKIAAVGCTGRCTGAHLHFALVHQDVPVDPAEFVKGLGHRQLGLPIAKGYRITSTFGARTNPETNRMTSFNNGIDLAAPQGTDVYAADNGIVTTVDYSPEDGNRIVIKHTKELETTYTHLQDGSTVVSVGTAVKRGQKIAAVGSTGRSTGSHLHFAVSYHGSYVDPIGWVLEWKNPDDAKRAEEMQKIIREEEERLLELEKLEAEKLQQLKQKQHP